MSNDREAERKPENSFPPVYDPQQDLNLVCELVRRETHDVKTFLFRPEPASLVRFEPGQFLTLELEIDGTAINRCYTISSPPTRPERLCITVKRHPGGLVSNWLHDTMRPGTTVKSLPPAGHFSFRRRPGERYLFLSGGSGITPLMSMSRTLYDLGDDRDTIFVHSARSPQDIIFKNELSVFAGGLSRFHTAFVCENAAPGFDGMTGFLDGPKLAALAPDLLQREIFCCGPRVYMDAVRAALMAANFDLAHYHEESFSFATPEALKAATPIDAAADKRTEVSAADRFKITFTRSGRTIDCAPDQFILEAARAAGLRLPFSCAKGLCGTCKSKKVSGDVEMNHAGGIRPREIEAGMFLPCCSKPLSDVVIER